MLYSALIGTGYQLIVLVVLVIFFAMAGSLYLERGGLITASITSYALSSIVAGYVSGGFYNQ
jgi:transmembrane 9 superfamily protein 3